MLRKFVSIKNVGRFVRYCASGDVELKRYNLIFAENGRGKTTLCAILRSLQSGEGAHVIGRTTLGAIDPPEAEIFTSRGMTAFRQGTWNGVVSDIAIFDSTFVSENVHSGDVVNIGHRRSLYSVIVGKRGVDLAREIELLDCKSRAKAAEVTEKAVAVQTFVPREMALDTFLALEEDLGIADKIETKERELDAVKQAAQIQTRAALRSVTLPVFDRRDLEELLRKSVEGIASNAERQVRDQINQHAMHIRGQAWLSEGLRYVQGESCPFCNQSLDGAADLLAAYRDFFSHEYNELRDEIIAMRRRLETSLSDRAIGDLERTLDQNATSVEFWTRFCEFATPQTPDGGGDTLRAERDSALALLDRKAAAPLEPVVVDATLANADSAFVALQQKVEAYNQAVADANTIIAAKKKATVAADVKTVEAALIRLRAIKSRFEPDAREACDEHTRARIEKNEIEDNKIGVRKQLDEYTEQVIGRYQDTINNFLSSFNAGFRITGIRHGYPGGVASSSYQILINNTAVDLGDSETPLDKPSFRNTLSSGDKSTLALAFFLAQLAHDPDKAKKIVIFDDPFNSQDGFRQDCTVQKIRKCGEECAQVIVLSHDPRFLKRVWDRIRIAGERKSLKLARIGEYDTTICEWDVEEENQARFQADHKVLTEYYNEGIGDPRNVVQKIRPVLESYCKYLSPGSFAETDWLGDIIAKIRAAGPGNQLFPSYECLDELNEYTKRYHHGEGHQPATEPINDTELQGAVKRTIDFTGGC
jgi:wobble nucleotide-excising tRNase